MDSGLSTIWSAAVTSTLSPYRNPRCSTEPPGSPWGACPPPLWIRRCTGPEPRHCGQGKAPSPRRGWNPALRFPANAAGVVVNIKLVVCRAPRARASPRLPRIRVVSEVGAGLPAQKRLPNRLLGKSPVRGLRRCSQIVLLSAFLCSIRFPAAPLIAANEGK